MPRSTQVGVPSGCGLSTWLMAGPFSWSVGATRTLAGGYDSSGRPTGAGRDPRPRRPARSGRPRRPPPAGGTGSYARSRRSVRLQDRQDVAGRVLEPGDRRPLLAHDPLRVDAVVPLEDHPAAGELVDRRVD